MKKIKDSGIIKGLVYAIVGIITYPGLNIINSLKICGTEHLQNLPKKKVLFVSNHQTYFADVIAFIHIFCAVKWRKQNKLGIPYYLLWPFTKIKYVAAEETMNSSLLTKFFTLAGALTVKRTWNEGGKEIRRGLDPSDTRKIFKALDDNWVITFPQGTTKAFAPGRKGTAHIIKQTKPIVIPVVIKGFSRAFNKKGLVIKRRGTPLQVTFKAPLNINFDDSTEAILAQVMDAIEQSKAFMPVIPKQTVTT
ncbi:lysophospholipid acyltransferase family protein [Ferruginibacter yonginensis]|uniref:Lysophospholipid acyltransferase family protein n=1 Tax=Ferruginibacter yonginensis TaxID=1310416 RepID=A0ABV8QNY5_9BACT